MKETTTDKFDKASTKLADWGLRVIFIKILGLNKKGSNPSVKMVMKGSTKPNYKILGLNKKGSNPSVKMVIKGAQQKGV